MIPSLTYFQLLLEFVRGVYWPQSFQCFMDWILERMLERSNWGASFGNVKISDLDFADDSVIFVTMLDILMGALEALNEE